MKNFVRVIFFILLGFAILYLMNMRGLLDVSLVVTAFKSGKNWVLLVILLQFIQISSMLFRYRIFVKLFGVNVRFPQVAAATFVSGAVGQWAPGAMAVTEVLRVGLMVGAHKQKGDLAQNEHAGAVGSPSIVYPYGVRTRLAVASLFDRLVGFFTILGAGALAAGIILIQNLLRSEFEFKTLPLLLLFVFSSSGALFLAALPILSRWIFMERILEDIQNRCFRGSARSLGAVQWVLKTTEKIVGQIRQTRKAISEGSDQLQNFLIPFFLSCISLLSSALALSFASRASGNEMSAFAAVAAFPVIAVSQLLPLGFGGMGGYQLVAVAAFGIFGLNASNVSSASLLQNGLLLIQNTLLGIIFARLSANQIKAVFQSQKSINRQHSSQTNGQKS